MPAKRPAHEVILFELEFIPDHLTDPEDWEPQDITRFNEQIGFGCHVLAEMVIPAEAKANVISRLDRLAATLGDVRFARTGRESKFPAFGRRSRSSGPKPEPSTTGGRAMHTSRFFIAKSKNANTNHCWQCTQGRWYNRLMEPRILSGIRPSSRLHESSPPKIRRGGAKRRGGMKAL